MDICVSNSHIAEDFNYISVKSFGVLYAYDALLRRRLVVVEVVSSEKIKEVRKGLTDFTDKVAL